MSDTGMATSLGSLGLLPPEIRSMVYKEVLTRPGIVFDLNACKPDAFRANLSSQFLRCNKRILVEALPILYCGNTFEIRWSGYLGLLIAVIEPYGHNLIKQLVFTRLYFNKTQFKELQRFRALERIAKLFCTFNFRGAVLPKDQASPESLRAKNPLRAMVRSQAQELSKQRPQLKYTSILEDCPLSTPTKQAVFDTDIDAENLYGCTLRLRLHGEEAE